MQYRQATRQKAPSLGSNDLIFVCSLTLLEVPSIKSDKVYSINHNPITYPLTNAPPSPNQTTPNAKPPQQLKSEAPATTSHCSYNEYTLIRHRHRCHRRHAGSSGLHNVFHEVLPRPLSIQSSCTSPQQQVCRHPRHAWY